MSSSGSNDQSEQAWQPGNRGWHRKFADAFKGIKQGVSGQSSFAVHAVATIVVLITGFVLQCSAERWCLLLLCIGIVIAAELFNSSLEWLSRSVATHFDPNVEKALNIASGAVLVVAMSAVSVAIIILFTSQ